MLSRIALRGLLAGLMVAILASAAAAHHSFAPHFDRSRPVDIAGTIKSYEARNPHSYLHIDAVDENGRTREYVCESHGVTQLTRIGITPQLLKAGIKVRVTGPISRHSPYMCFFETVELADGRSFNVNGPGGRNQRRYRRNSRHGRTCSERGCWRHLGLEVPAIHNRRCC